MGLWWKNGWLDGFAGSGVEGTEMNVADIAMALFMLVVAGLVVAGFYYLLPRRGASKSLAHRRRDDRPSHPEAFGAGSPPRELKLDELGRELERLIGLGPLNLIDLRLDSGAQVQLLTWDEPGAESFALNVFPTGHAGDLGEVRRKLAQAELEVDWRDTGHPEFPLIDLGNAPRTAVKQAARVLSALFGTKKGDPISIVELD